MISRALLWLALAGLLLPAACQRAEDSGRAKRSGSAASANSRPHYVVTVTPLSLILAELCGRRASVTALLRPGVNSHTYDPVPSDAAAVQQATGFFWIGAEYDAWAADFSTPHSIQLLPLLPAEQIIDLAPHQEWGAKAEAHEKEAADSGHIPDPHFYTDPQLVRALLPRLTEKLCELDPGGATEYQANAAAFADRLAALDKELQQRLAHLQGRPVIMFHPSFNYFLRRYGLVYAGCIEPFPGKEPSPKYLQAIVKQVQAVQASAIFSETLLPAAPAEVIAEAAHCKVIELDPSCGNSGRSYQNYADWLRYNAGLFEEGLR